MTSAAAIAPGRSLYLDTNVVVYAAEGSPLLTSAVQALLLRMDHGELGGVTSELTLSEFLVKPLCEGNHALAEQYRQRLSPGPALTVAPVTRDVLERAAELRAAHPSLKLPDAIHAATALLTACDVFLTNDARFATVPGLRALMLADVKTP